MAKPGLPSQGEEKGDGVERRTTQQQYKVEELKGGETRMLCDLAMNMPFSVTYQPQPFSTLYITVCIRRREG